MHAGAFFLAVLLFQACTAQEAVPTPSLPAGPVPASPVVLASPSPTLSSPAIIINGEVITLDIYQAHLARFQAAQVQLGTNLATTSDIGLVAEDLINRQLLSQAARAAGFTAHEDIVEQRLSALMEEIGGAEVLVTWMQNNYYTPESLRTELALEMEAAWMRDDLLAEVPATAEQVLARQVLFFTAFEAERIFAQLENGASFDTIVANNDPGEDGYLGWFPRGFLLDPELEQAAFALQPGQYSSIIQTRHGFHILQVLEYDPERPLSPDALLRMQALYLADWLASARSQAQIEILVP